MPPQVRFKTTIFALWISNTSAFLLSTRRLLCRKLAKPTERETEAGFYCGRCQQTPRLPLLPAKDWPLPYRIIPPVDGQTPEHEILVVSVQHQTRELAGLGIGRPDASPIEACSLVPSGAAFP